MNRLRVVRLTSLGLMIVLLVLVLSDTDRDRMRQAFSELDWGWAVWVPVLNVLNTWIESIRLSVILFPIRKKLRVRNAFNATLLGILGNILLPLRFGDGARAYFLARTEKINISSSLSILMLDRIADFSLFFVFIGLTAMVFPFPPSMRHAGYVAGGLFVGAVFCVGAVALLGRRFLQRFSSRFGRRISEELNRFIEGLSVIRNAGMVLPVCLLSAFSWVLRALMVWVMFNAFHLNLPLVATPVTLILLNFGIAVVSTPANLGGFEIAATAALSLFGVDIEVGLSYSVALHMIEVIPILVTGMVILWCSGYSSRDVIRMGESGENGSGGTLCSVKARGDGTKDGQNVGSK